MANKTSRRGRNQRRTRTRTQRRTRARARARSGRKVMLGGGAFGPGWDPEKR